MADPNVDYDLPIQYHVHEQFANIFPFLQGPLRPNLPPPRWLVIGGPSDDAELRMAKLRWPDIRIVAAEPNLQAPIWYSSFPREHGVTLVRAALLDREGTAEMVREAKRPRNGSLYELSRQENRTNPLAIYETVPTTTLDSLDATYGPFEDAIVWMDIERSELEALRGATGLLRRRAVMLWNIEIMSNEPGHLESVYTLVTRHGYRAVRDWNESTYCRDRVYLRE